MKSLNLLQLLPSLQSGGVEQGTIDVANFLSENNVNSFIVSNGGPLVKKLNRKVQHIKMPVHSKNFLMMPLLAHKLNKIIKSNHIDIVHVRSRAPAWLLQFVNKKSFTTVSTFHNVYGSSNLLKKNYSKVMSKVDHIIAISNYVKSQIKKTYDINSHKITVINRGIDTNLFNPKLNQKDEFIVFLKKFNIPDDKKIILYPGRLTGWKGQMEFLSIVEYFKNQNIIFYFVGDDKNKSFALKLIKEIKNKNLQNNCKILGQVSNSDLKMLYYCCDLVVSAPIKPEGFGRSVSESLSMKKIIISYNYGGVKDQLKALDNIYKVEPHNQIEMRDKINKAINFSLRYKNNLGSSSRDHIIKNFSKELMLKKYLKYYYKIIT